MGYFQGIMIATYGNKASGCGIAVALDNSMCMRFPMRRPLITTLFQ